MNKKSSFITRVDAAIIGLVLFLLVAVGVVVRYVLQKDTMVTVELLASGGEWWWGVPPPYYWNARDLSVGAKEFDTQKTPAVEIVDIVKYAEDDRRFMWMKVRLRAKRNVITNQYVFRQENLQIGKTIHIAPNNVALIGHVVGIEGVGQIWDTEYVTMTGKAVLLRPWEAEVFQVGDEIRDNKGDLVAQITSVDVQLADVMTTNAAGDTFARKNPLLRDVTLTFRMRVVKDSQMRYFNYYQPVGVGNKVRIQFPKASVEVLVMSVAKAP